MTEILIGRHRRKPLGAIDDEAARRIAESGRALAVTLDPDGGWWLEAPETVAEDDMVGVYRGDFAFSLYRDIAADMKHELTSRGIA
ncbi:hypothetical protein [Novilysobacter erysipheiresistens]|uniref:Uncharacterized protein n=1 Tax=Novilysobacter erysipheiresistens TaxID=1749332 RepID=A0ABU7YUW4_9GAMM